MLSVRVVNHGENHDIKCLCHDDKRYVEGEWPDNGWTFSAGQCCDCMNVWGLGIGPMHICDLDAFIEMLQAIKSAKESQRGPSPAQGDPGIRV